jgi:hypothetical protein
LNVIFDSLYLHILLGKDGSSSILSCTHLVEKYVEQIFLPLYNSWVNNEIDDEVSYTAADDISVTWMEFIVKIYNEYMK